MIGVVAAAHVVTHPWRLPWLIIWWLDECSHRLPKPPQPPVEFQTLG